MRSGFWQGRRVLVTGHTGFKGAWLSLWLHRLGAEVTGFSLAEMGPHGIYAAAGVGALVHSVTADVRDPQAVREALARAAPEVVFHLAAQALVRESYRDPLGTYATNVLGTANVLAAAAPCATVRAIVVVTSDKCYEEEGLRGHPETDPLGGADPYSSSKACAELVAAAWRRSYLRVSADQTAAVLATARAGNVIGGGDWAPDRIIPDCVRAIAADRELVVRYPAAVRPWQFVLEPLRGYLRLAERCLAQGPEYGEAWNFGPGPEGVRPVSWLVQRFAELTGNRLRYRVDTGANPHEAGYLALDCAKAGARLAWHPVLDVEQTLVHTAAWYHAWLEGRDLRDFTLAQLAQYEELCAGVGERR